MSAEMAVQIALRSRLVIAPGVTAVVPAEHIIDRNSRPALNPSIVLGEMQCIDEGGSVSRTLLHVYSTLHVWKREPSLVGVRHIVWAITCAVRPGRLELGPAFHCVDCALSSTRYLRDPDGETGHAVMTIKTIVQVLP